MIDPEDFEHWRDHPVTEAMHRALCNLAERNRNRWMEVSWDGGNTDKAVLADLKARFEVAYDLAGMTVEELNEALNEE